MNIFIAFANQDRDVRDQLLRQMNLVKDRHGWSIWSAKEIKAGERWGDEIERRLQDSEVIILLLSTDFFNSKYIIEKELPAIVERHRQGECHIIPVIARSCHWQETPFGEYTELGEIQALPAGGKSIVSRGNWDSDDQPYFEVVQGVRDSIRAFQVRKRKSIETGDIVQNESETTDDGLAVSASEQQEKESHATFLNSMTDVEDEYWKGTRKLDVKEIYEKFIRENPNHPKVTEAAKRIRWKERSFMGDNTIYFKNCDDCPMSSVSWGGGRARERTGRQVTRLPYWRLWQQCLPAGRRGKEYFLSMLASAP